MTERIEADFNPSLSPISMVNPSLSPEEEVAIVDEKNAVIGSAPRAAMRKQGLIHRATYIFVFDAQGRLFVQERTLTKDIFPGCLDLCAGGVVLAGEGYEESATRELEEELGIRDASLAFHFDFYGEYTGQKVWGRVFSCVSDGPFVLQPEEVSAGAFHSIDEVKHLIRAMPCTPDSVYAFLRYLDPCSGKEALSGAKDTMEVSRDMMTREQAREFASRWLPAWTGNDPEKLAAFYSDDALYLDPTIPQGVKGKDALLKYFRKLLSHNPDWVWTQIEPIPMEGGFLNKWLAKIPVGDKVIECIGVCFVQFDAQGLIWRNEVYFDCTRLNAAIAALISKAS